MNATHQLAPTPDYSSGLPADIELCSCEEALALRAEVTRLTEALAEAEREHQKELLGQHEVAGARCETLEAERDFFDQERIKVVEQLEATEAASLRAVTAEQMAVLDAMAAVTDHDCRWRALHGHPVWKAELARRGLNP